jgi:hypothetical protein
VAAPLTSAIIATAYWLNAARRVIAASGCWVQTLADLIARRSTARLEAKPSPSATQRADRLRSGDGTLSHERARRAGRSKLRHRALAGGSHLARRETRRVLRPIDEECDSLRTMITTFSTHRSSAWPAVIGSGDAPAAPAREVADDISAAPRFTA